MNGCPRFDWLVPKGANSRLLCGGTHDDYSITSSAATGRVCIPREAERLRRGRDGVTGVYLLRSAEYQFAIVVYSECMRVECRLALNQPWGSRRATWPRKRRRQRRRQPRRKRSNRSTKTLFRNTDGRLLSLTEYPHNSQAGPLCKWLLHNGPGFHLWE